MKAKQPPGPPMTLGNMRAVSINRGENEQSNQRVFGRVGQGLSHKILPAGGATAAHQVMCSGRVVPAYQVMSLWLAGSGKFSQFGKHPRCWGAIALGRGVRAHHGFGSGIRKVIATGIATTQSAAIIQNAIPPRCW